MSESWPGGTLSILVELHSGASAHPAPPARMPTPRSPSHPASATDQKRAPRHMQMMAVNDLGGNANGRKF